MQVYIRFAAEAAQDRTLEKQVEIYRNESMNTK